MTQEELQDYAVDLQQQLASKVQELEQSNKDKAELHDLNKVLQKRNNDLFMKVQQQPTTEPEPADEPVSVPTCEEVAKNLYKELNK